MDFRTQRVIDQWDEEVGAEMRRLIQHGTPPMDAASQARENVSRRRRAASMTSADFAALGKTYNDQAQARAGRSDEGAEA